MNSTQKIEQEQILIKYTNRLSSPIQVDQEIFCVSQNGDIIKLNAKGQAEVVFTILGHPSSIYNRGIGSSFFVSDFAHQSIFIRQNQENQQIHNLITEYNQRAFNGPNTLKVASLSNALFFTDSGPFCQTSIENPSGSLFVYRFDDKTVRALSHRNLAYPCGLQIDQNQKYVLVCQLGNNRILKFLIDQNYSGNHSVFYQFNGRFGPSSICQFDDIYYVSLFQFKQLSEKGMVALLNKSGELLQKIQLPTGPQITGISILSTESSTGGCQLLVTQSNKLHQISFKGDKTEIRDQSVILDKK